MVSDVLFCLFDVPFFHRDVKKGKWDATISFGTSKKVNGTSKRYNGTYNIPFGSDHNGEYCSFC